ncbi:hypothetical protein PHYSODRAFT_304503 [Phytophthora sojae]|uniref:Uncharacterized protein n=1 Tax=Phytophthora sojae (strain P6497) TaxID=1094619 RepID=G5A1C2_PHYSP|nr:hypothetical protein PHYSODRAFT_304503 [Phytophthora sojae]EGZ10721.1 hypothetical protein PHYSODRAFT_304503 [Phytophthora sojae]|eukprot:XP_009533466.1 hypothetical protein PHYSODRAFT_304503 [Phytophthora sojae]
MIERDTPCCNNAYPDPPRLSTTSDDTENDLGYGFNVYVSADASVVKLKEVIKRETEEYELLKQLKVPASVKEMLIPENELDPLSFVGDDAYGFPNRHDNGPRDIHLLVKLPDNWSREQELWNETLASTRRSVSRSAVRMLSTEGYEARVKSTFLLD